MGNKFREFSEGKLVCINIHFDNKGYAEAFKYVIENVENNLTFYTRQKSHHFVLDLNNKSKLSIKEAVDATKYVLLIETYISKNVNIAFLDSITFKLTGSRIATREFYCEIKDTEESKLSYKMYKTELFSEIKLK